MSLTVDDKLRVAEQLDHLGVTYIEGGWPGANPKDDEFFRRAPTELSLSTSTLVAFGSTRRAGVAAEDDEVLRKLVDAQTPVVCIVAKSWDRHVVDALRTSLDEAVAMVADSVAFLQRHDKRVFLDAEHFFDAPVRDMVRPEAYADVLRFEEHLVAPSAALPARARGLGAAEGLTQVAHVLAVDEAHPRLDRRSHAMGTTDVFAEDVAAQSVWRLVGEADRFCLVVKWNQAGHRPEDLLLRDRHAIVDIGKDGRKRRNCRGQAHRGARAAPNRRRPSRRHR